MSSIAVVGAGVIGLSSAVSILEKDPTVKVTLIADKFSPYTTSDGAAGLIMPFVMGSTPVQLQRYLAHLHFLLGSFYMSSSWKGFFFLNFFIKGFVFAAIPFYRIILVFYLRNF